MKTAFARIECTWYFRLVFIALVGVSVFWLIDVVQGPPQEAILTRDEGYVARPGGEVDIRYFSVKTRDCRLIMRGRWFYRLDGSGQRTGDRWYVAAAEYVPPNGKAGIGRDAQVIRLHVPLNVPPGKYEYVADIARRCIPYVGMTWEIPQQPAQVLVLSKDGD